MTEQASPSPQIPAQDDAASLLPRQRPVVLAFKLLLVPIGLALVVSFLLDRLHDEPLRLHWPPLLAGLVLAQISFTMGAVRMWAVLRVFGLNIDHGFAQKLHLQSAFYSVFVPLSVGMEICRFVKIRARRPGVDTVTLLSALLVDRLLGVIGTVAIVVVAGSHLLLERGWLTAIDPWLVAGAAAALAALGAGFLAIPRVRRLAWSILAATAGRRSQLLPLLLLSTLLTTAFGVAVAFAGRGLGLEVQIVDAVVGIAGGQLGQMVPLSLLGAGPGEAAGVALFLAQGYSAAAAGLLVAIAYGLRLLMAMEGGLIEAAEDWRGVARHRAASNTRRRAANV